MPKFGDKDQRDEADAKDKVDAMEAIDRKTSGTTHLGEDARAQLAALQEAKKRPPLIIEPRCRACQSEHRGYIDGILARGNVNYSKLAAKLPKNKDGLAVTRRSLKTHAEKHLNVQQGVLREIMIHEAERQGKDWENAVQGAFTYRGMHEAALRQFYEDLDKGTVRIEAKDALAILKDVREMDRQAETEAVDQARATVTAFIQAIMNTVPGEYWEPIVNKVEEILRGSGIELDLIMSEETEPVDAEVVELTAQQESRLLALEREVDETGDNWDR